MTPRPGEIFYLTKDKPYQIITMGIHKETCESMVIYQALFGDYGTFVLPLSKFLEEVQEENFKARTPVISESKHLGTDGPAFPSDEMEEAVATKMLSINKEYDSDGKVNHILINFLDADSYSEKLDVITTHIKAMDDRLINDMAASLDCTVEEGPTEKRLQELMYCLKQLSRFEVRRR